MVAASQASSCKVTQHIFLWKPMRGISQPALSVPSISSLILSVIGFYQGKTNMGLIAIEHNSATVLHAHILPAHNNQHLPLVLIALLGMQSTISYKGLLPMG